MHLPTPSPRISRKKLLRLMKWQRGGRGLLRAVVLWALTVLGGADFTSAQVVGDLSISQKEGALSTELDARADQPINLGPGWQALFQKALLRPVDAQVEYAEGRLRVQTGRKAQRPGVAFQPPEGFWDITGFGLLEIDVKNTGDRPLPVHCAIENPAAERAERKNCCIGSATIPPGQKQGIQVPIQARIPEALREKLRGMRATPGGFRDRGPSTIDPSKVSAIAVYVWRPGTEYTLEVSGIRLVKGQEAFPLPHPIEKLFPMIDRFGQYRHKDWPGKTHSEEDLRQHRQEEAQDLAKHPGPKDWNPFGSWTGGPKLQATGRFRLTKWQGKWYFVDPEGRLFWSHGLVRVTWSYGYTPITGREHLFEQLPDRQGPFGVFYGRSCWPIAGLYETGTETYNFTGANLFRKYGPGWQQEYIDLVHRRMRSWGINTLANCSQPAIYLKRRTPYTATVYDLRCPPQETPGNVGYVGTIHTAGRVLEATSGGWGKFPDVFDPSFRQTLRREISQHKNAAVGDPWCLGYFLGNELNWGRDETSLARAVLVCPADQPAKQVFLKDLQAKYAAIEKLNAAWKTQYPSWEAMRDSTKPLAPEQGQKEDFIAFLEKTADAYFRQCRDTLKEIDPEGLYLGCRFAGWSHGPVFRASAKYCDVVSVNRYTASVADLRLPEGIDKPVLIGEFHFGALDRGKFHATLCPVPDQNARAEAYERYVRSALENPLIVGVHWHQYGDQATSGRDDGENFQNGFVDVCDTPYVETIEAARRVGYRLYEIRSSQPLGPAAKK